MAEPVLSPHERRHSYSAIFASVAFSTTGFLAVTTVNSLVAEDITGSAAWSGMPSAASVLGTALGASALTAAARRLGPRTGLALGYALAAFAIAGAAYAIPARHIGLFVAAQFVFGIGFGSNRIARYVVADMYPVTERGTMIGWVVWASTIGAVAGPALVAPSLAIALWLQMPGLIGPYLVCLLAAAVSGAVMMTAPRRMDDRRLTTADASSSPAGAGSSIATLLSEPRATLALVSMVSGQFVMVLLMTMTPVHVRHEGHGLGAIGAVISAHTIGMFALSPITGKLADRFGRVPVLKGAVSAFVVACLFGVVAAGSSSYPLLLVSLLLLGVAWNLGFVAGTALLTDSVPRQDRSRVQGFGDSLIWGGSAIASIASGWMLERTGFAVLSMIGLVIALAPVLPLWKLRAR